MRFPVRFSFAFIVFGALLVCPGTRAEGQAAPSSQSSSGQSSSTQGAAAQNPEPAPAPAYVSIDPLANVRYDNRYDLSLTLAYAHFKAGPNILQGANLGGLNLEGSYWLTKRFAIEGTGRAYMGTSGAGPNSFVRNGHTETISGPFVAEYIFAAGPEFLGPHNKHGALIAHVMAGGAYGKFEQDLRGQPSSLVAFYHDQVAPALVMGGHLDLNRSPRWVFRVTVDGLLTDYAINWGAKNRQIDINTAVSVGVEYKFKSKR
jgi:hypothetical protein